MIRAKTKTTRKGPDWHRRLKAAAEQMDGSYVEIGVTQEAGNYPDGESVAMVAAVNEFGYEGTGRDGRRIAIPERSFLRAAVRVNAKAINAWRDQVLGNVVGHGWDAHKALTSMGTFIQILVQNMIKSNVPPPNSPSTLRYKARHHMGNKTLQELGVSLLLRSISHRVVARDGGGGGESGGGEHT